MNMQKKHLMRIDIHEDENKKILISIQSWKEKDNILNYVDEAIKDLLLIRREIENENYDRTDKH